MMKLILLLLQLIITLVFTPPAIFAALFSQNCDNEEDEAKKEQITSIGKGIVNTFGNNVDSNAISGPKNDSNDQAMNFIKMENLCQSMEELTLTFSDSDSNKDTASSKEFETSGYFSDDSYEMAATSSEAFVLVNRGIVKRNIKKFEQYAEAM